MNSFLIVGLVILFDLVVMIRAQMSWAGWVSDDLDLSFHLLFSNFFWKGSENV